ncbi:MAG: GerAB/ArcD/ProY family transporter [Oscillospiraceae bacterium]
MQKVKVSGFQIVSLLFLSRVFNVMTYIPVFAQKMEGTTLLLGNLLGFLGQFILIIPAIIFYDVYKGKNVITVAYEKFNKFGIIIAAVYLIMMVLGAIGSLVGFEYFMVNAVFGDISAQFLIITMCIATFYAAIIGIEGLARVSTIIFVLFFISTIVIITGSLKSASLLNITPIIDDDFSDILKCGLLSLSKNAELVLLIILFPNVKSSFKKCSFWLMSLSYVAIEVMAFLILAVLGKSWQDQTFPYFTLTSIAELSIFQRLDTLHMTMWVLISFLRISAFIIAANWILKQMLPYKKRKFSVLILIAIIPTLAIITSQNTSLMMAVNPTFGTSIILALELFIIPLILVCFKPKKQ